MIILSLHNYYMFQLYYIHRFNVIDRSYKKIVSTATEKAFGDVFGNLSDNVLATLCNLTNGFTSEISHIESELHREINRSSRIPSTDPDA